VVDVPSLTPTSDNAAEGAPTGPGCLPLPDAPGCTISGFMELPDGRFGPVDERATDEQFDLGAELARRRINRCRRGSTNWLWYRSVLAEHGRRRGVPLIALPGGPVVTRLSQQEIAAADASMEAHLAGTDVRYLANLFRGITTTQHVLLDLDPERVVAVCRDDDDRRADLLRFIGRLRAWTKTVESGLGRNLRSVR